ncbi:O-acetylserine/cysteine efflux transporter [Vogesella indigofera]|uniref:O-acetylserine/cysteine efflux transporter n=1 Tax=Vogesella indigofera TaxID=45465 RepID=A0A495BBU4_VOGIN|nr:EamA family transporter [Vogesella indigofera]RKQ57953.1 O-acetylserine/cysteine efflux transporter [Vogesella indigofera]
MNWQDRLIALAIVAVWGFNFVVIKWGVAGVPPFLLGALRFAAAAGIGLLFVRRPNIPWRWLALYGLTMGLGQFACLFSAMKLGMPAGLASIVLQSSAFFTLLIGMAWLRERFSGWQLGGLVVGGCGLYLIGGLGAAGLPLAGFVLTLCAAACWAFSNVVVRRIVGAGYQPDMLGLVVWGSLAPIVPFFALSAMFESASIDWAQVLSGKSLFAIGYLALIATLFGYGQWSKLLSRHAANVVAPYSLLVPLVGVLSSALVLGERLSFWQLAGGVVLVSGLAINMFGPRLLALLRKPQPA